MNPEKIEAELKTAEVKAKAAALTAAEWILLIVLAVGSAAVYEYQHPTQAEQPQQQQTAQRTT